MRNIFLKFDNLPDENEEIPIFMDSQNLKTPFRIKKSYKNGFLNKKTVRKKSLYRFFIILSILAFIVSSLFFVKHRINDNSDRIKVVSLNWERKICIEKNIVVRKEDSKLPEGARLISYEDRIIGYTYEDGSKSVIPIYRGIYTFEINEWVVDRYLTSEGFNKDVYWPNRNQLSENERLGNKYENYFINCIDNHRNPKSYVVKYDIWKNLEVGQKIKLSSIIGKE